MFFLLFLIINSQSIELNLIETEKIINRNLQLLSKILIDDCKMIKFYGGGLHQPYFN